MNRDRRGLSFLFVLKGGLGLLFLSPEVSNDLLAHNDLKASQLLPYKADTFLLLSFIKMMINQGLQLLSRGTLPKDCLFLSFLQKWVGTLKNFVVLTASW